MDIMDLATWAPSQVVGGVRRVVGAASDVLVAAEQVPLLVLRADALLTAAEVLVLRAGVVVTDAEEVAGRAGEVAAEAHRVTADVGAVQLRASVLLASVEPLIGVVAQIEVELVRAVVAVLDRIQPLLTAVTALPPELPGEAARLVHTSLPLIEELGVTLAPMLREVRAVVPDIGDILQSVQRIEPVMTDMETRIAGLPGSSLLRKRGERELEEAAGNGS